MEPAVLIRPEIPADHAAVTRVVGAAFPESNEALLVERLRRARQDVVSLVAELDREVVGHILFTPVTIRDEDRVTSALALGPMAVEPDHQRLGIGSQLVAAGLQACARRGAFVVFVVGHPAFYPRFGFVPAGPMGLHYKDEHYDPYLFVVELRDGALGETRGWIEYHPEFDNL